MADKLYDLMDWAAIEAIVYSEENKPRRTLGPRVTKDGVLIQCFFPEKTKVMLKTTADRVNHRMKMQDENGFFAILLPGKKIPEYVYVIQEEGKYKEYEDPYAFPTQITHEEEVQFSHGICYDIYEKLGAHPMRVNGRRGVHFAVWAPNALRVSVVGDFNGWDGRMYQMEKLEESGIFELFIPGIEADELYKFELKLRDGLTYLKADPYANAAQLRPDTASVVTNLRKYRWNDQSWMTNRKKVQGEDKPMYIYELHLGSFRKPEDGRLFCNYREIAPVLVDYVRETGYTHVELMPVMEHPLDESWGYQVSGYYAPTRRYGSPQDFMAFVDALHEAGIGVILDWVPAHFPKDIAGLAAFDGTCLYEHQDPRQGMHPHWGTLIFNYGRPQVSNFLISNALFWAEKYHIDGIRMDAVASMLYLDYGKNDGEWVANIYGGNENLEAIEFLRHLNSIFKKRYPDVMMIAEESTSWPKVTESVKKDGLGFDYKWNMGWMNDFLGYMEYDPVFRGAHHNELTFSMVYAYSERFLLGLSHDEFVHEKKSLIEKMPGDDEQKFSNMRAALTYMVCHPGKKLLFMGQDFAQIQEWSESRQLDWDLMEEPKHREFYEFFKALLKMYKSCPALYERDYDTEGFIWINEMEWEKNILTFMRCGKKRDDMLLIVCNFSAVSYPEYQVGVPKAGKYKEIFNSDAKKYGGSGMVNPRVKASRPVECDERADSVKIKAAPLSVAVFEYRKG
ncbi:1,4-alpha-glucan branching protein GlgB [Ruminococcus gauvreauii]|uniref:1,4-alpha-glucan branching protein GlgB n=1 Tax=Ruminococcus gauvreauii TaxID=438033 RepID=UPI0039844079